MKAKMLIAAALFVISACHVVVIGDLKIDWTYNGSKDPTVCSKYNIDYWLVAVERGGISQTQQFPCGTNWDTGYVFENIEEGIYTIIIGAYKTGMNQPLASKSQSNFLVNDNSKTIPFNFTDADFGGAFCGDKTCNSGTETCENCPADCGACANMGVLNVYWNINGTTNETSKGPSWDSCTEVSAAKAVVIVDGKETSHDCDANGQMSVGISVEKKPTSVQVKLVNSSNQDLTTLTPAAAPDAVPGQTNKWEYIGVFYFDSFTNQNVHGDYLFKVSYEGGKSCNQVSPQIGFQYTMLKLNGNLVPNASVCGPGNNYTDCVLADGTKKAVCYDSSTTQKIKNQTWGEYKLTVKGSEAVNDHQCWVKEFDILIGAGTENPVKSLDVPKDTNSLDAYCKSI